jgi:hypothetical protein
MQDKDLQHIYRAWANEKFPNYAPVTKVEFRYEYRGPYSDVTPDIDSWIEVEIHTDRPRHPNPLKLIHYDLTELINEITTFSVEYKVATK